MILALLFIFKIITYLLLFFSPGPVFHHPDRGRVWVWCPLPPAVPRLGEGGGQESSHWYPGDVCPPPPRLGEGGGPEGAHHHPGVCITVLLLPSTEIVKKKKMITALSRPQYRFYSCLGQMDFPRFLEDFFWKTPDADPVPVGFFWSVLRCRAFFMNSRVSINSGSLRQL